MNETDKKFDLAIAIENLYFNSPSKGRLILDDVVNEIINYFKEDAKSRYKIIIGSDSNSGLEPEFVTAIVALRVGRGGRYFYKKRNGLKIASLRHKIHQEVNYSLETAHMLISKLREKIGELSLDFGPEIHIDIGENGPTKEVIKEVVNIVLANGFKVKYKPESYAATSVADKYT